MGFHSPPPPPPICQRCFQVGGTCPRILQYGQEIIHQNEVQMTPRMKTPTTSPVEPNRPTPMISQTILMTSMISARLPKSDSSAETSYT